MAATPESLVKKKVVAKLKAAGAYYFFPATHGMGRSGVPDIIVCINGRFLGIECKAGKNKPTALQEHEMACIRAAGGMTLVVNEATLALVDEALRQLKEQQDV